MGITLKRYRMLRTKLDNLGGSSEEAVLTAIKKTVLAAEASAKANAPVGGGSQAESTGTGALRASITHEVKASGGRVEGRVYTNARHAAYVEFGTGPVGAANHGGISPNVRVNWTTREYWIYPTVIDGQKTFRRTSGQPARPFLYPAAVEHKETFLEGVRQELVMAMRRIVKGGG